MNPLAHYPRITSKPLAHPPATAMASFVNGPVRGTPDYTF